MAEWEIRFSSSRQLPYYFDKATGTSQWEPPAALSEEQIKALPGAENLNRTEANRTDARPNQVRASHILYKHTGSRRPSSWKQAVITRSPAESKAAIEGHIATLNELPAGQRAKEFANIASTESDCSSAKKGGDLGYFGPGMMQKAFEDATYALKVGELSPVVETDSGTHVILRTA